MTQELTTQQKDFFTRLQNKQPANAGMISNKISIFKNKIIERSDGSKFQENEQLTIDNQRNCVGGGWFKSDKIHFDKPEDHQSTKKQTISFQKQTIFDDGKGNKSTEQFGFTIDNNDATKGTQAIAGRSNSVFDAIENPQLNFQLPPPPKFDT